MKFLNIQIRIKVEIIYIVMKLQFNWLNKDVNW